MAVSPDLRGFVHDALAAGHGRAEISAALEKAGWTPRDIAEALGTYADAGTLPPVPKPRRYLAAREAFVYALLFIMLALTAGHLISLLFAVIDLWLPETGAYVYRTMMAEGQIRWSVSVLVVTTPLYLWLMRLSARQIEPANGANRSALRKWLTYLALLVSAMTLLGDASYVIYRLLQGDATLQFLLKALTVAGIAAAIFGYYLRDVEWSSDQPATMWFGWSVGALVLVSMAGGVWTIGGPQLARFDRMDRLRHDDLSQIATVLQCPRLRDGARPPLPETLSLTGLTEYCPGGNALFSETLTDPETGLPYAYRRIDDSRFEICAEFYDAERAFQRLSWSYPFDPRTGCLTGHTE